MKDIINFRSDKDFIKYLSRRGVFANVISKNTYGMTYLSKEENLVYKAFYGRVYECLPEEIITANDILLDSFIFPEKIFCVDEVLKGYTSDFVSTDLMPNLSNDFSLEKLERINFDNMIRAYYNLVVDTYRLSNQGVKMSDKIFNLLFNNERFSFIETHDYKYVSDNCTDINQRIVRDSITIPLDLAIGEYAPELSDEITDIEEYLREVEKIVNESKVKSKTYHY